jgi:uncharacterized protein (UPF0297 family)
MPQELGQNTVSFKKSGENEEQVFKIIKEVCAALEEKGYNPINQLVGYMISGDPAYITSHKQARNLICKIERDEIMELLLRRFLAR